MKKNQIKRQFNKPLNRRLINLYCKMEYESKSKRLRKKANKILESDWYYYEDKIGDYE
ncbi:hypothetical protein ONV75_08525 [Clostridium sp. LQ25]|uniref:hypothetical protein n=1 Tax=Clostridium TaxID=1485 RepID=UPI002058340D|nr:hypothetical protein [Clostridium sp. LQ25]UZT07899.1 hypothetical protein ONV75_08525 [Clostridium sp. LQ25]DAQ80619.1 MAG TPA: hypothetical protein [Inoviridae sp.]